MADFILEKAKIDKNIQVSQVNKINRQNNKIINNIY